MPLTQQVFCEIFDPVIKVRHNGYDPKVQKHHTDLDASKVRPKSCFLLKVVLDLEDSPQSP